jgi:hypothetical protein
MKREILKALVREGKKPMVRLTGELWDESFGQEGMIARVISAVDQPDDTLVEFVFDYNEKRDLNLTFDQPNWFLRCGDSSKMGTAIEAGKFKDPTNLTEEVVFDENEPVPVEFIEKETPLGEYLESDSKVGYVEWLEAKLEELVPNAMKTWKNGL